MLILLISIKKYTDILIVFLLLGVIICLVNWYGLPLLTATTKHAEPIVEAPELAIQPLAKTGKAAPEKFGTIFNEDGNQDLSSLTTEAIWKKLLTGFQDGQKVQISLENALIEHLRKEPDSAIYKELLSLFRQGALEGFAQQVLVSLLGEVGNYKSAETLISLVNENLLQEHDVKLAAFQAIDKFSPELWHEHPNTEFAPVFEAAWQTENAEFWPSIANVMASIGTPSSLDIFFETLTENTNAERVEIIKEAMTNLVNPALVPKLADLLENSTTENVRLASGNALANMGEVKAASALFDWSAQADAGKVGLVKQWFETAMNTTPEFVGYLETNLPNQKFASPEIKQAISLVLKDVKNGA
jgi:hypothetical protein